MECFYSKTQERSKSIMLHSFTVNLTAAALSAQTHILPAFVFCFVLPLGIASAIAIFTVESERPSKARQPVLPVGMVLLCYLGRLKGKIRSVSLALHVLILSHVLRPNQHSLVCKLLDKQIRGSLHLKCEMDG